MGVKAPTEVWFMSMERSGVRMSAFTASGFNPEASAAKLEFFNEQIPIGIRESLKKTDGQERRTQMSTNKEQNDDYDYTDVESAKDFFIKDRYAMVTSGIEIVAVDKGYAKTQMVIDERHRNAMGSVMGGAMFTLADFTFAVATNNGHPGTVTLSSSIQYLAAPKGNVLFCESKKIKDGRRNCFYEFLVTDDLGTEVALVTTTGAHLA